MDLLRRGGIQTLEKLVEVRRTAFLRAFAKAFAQFFRALRPGEETFQQSSQIKTGSPNNDGKSLASCNFLNGRSRLTGILTRSEGLVRLSDIEEMVRTKARCCEVGLAVPISK